MCLLKVYVESPETGEKALIAENIAFISAEDGRFKLLDIESKEKIVSNAVFLMIDALNSTLILRSRAKL